MDLGSKKQIYSRHFWLAKLVRVGLIVGLVLLLTQLWNWESQQDNDQPLGSTAKSNQTSTETNNQPSDQQETQLPAFEFSPPAGVNGPEDVQDGQKYVLADGAEVSFYEDGLATNVTDVTWTYTVDQSGSITLSDPIGGLCQAGQANCAANNGAFDITVRPADGQSAKLVFVIKDTNVTKTYSQVQQQYKQLLETVKVNQ